VALCVSFGACKRQERDANAPPADHAPDATAIDLTRLSSDWGTQQRVLRRPFAEIANRLGALRFEAKTRFVFSRGGQEHEQQDAYALTHDATGNVHVLLDTQKSSLEFYLMPGTLYVRHDRGQLRRRPRHDLDTESWCDLAFAPLPQILEPFGRRVRFLAPRPAKVLGRDALRVKLGLAPQDGAVGQDGSSESAAPAENLPRAAPASLPVPALARWRELAEPLGLEGRLWIDSATAVVLRAQIKGRIEIADRRVRPTQLSLSYDGAMTAIGDVPQVKPLGKAVDEFTRGPADRDLLGFFRDHLEPEKADTDQPVP
jgi:hypothetical protein